MSRLLTVTISNDTSDTLLRYMRARNNDIPAYMRLSKSKFVDACIRSALESNGVIIVADRVVEEPIHVIGLDAYAPPVVPPKSNMPPL
jgi:hypothetical protein